MAEDLWRFSDEPIPSWWTGSAETAHSSQGRVVVAWPSEPFTARTVLKSSSVRERAPAPVRGACAFCLASDGALGPLPQQRVLWTQSTGWKVYGMMRETGSVDGSVKIHSSPFGTRKYWRIQSYGHTQPSGLERQEDAQLKGAPAEPQR